MNTEEFQGTKGVWTTENVLTYSGDFYKVKAGDLSVCNITTRNQVSARANARLIAAAPDMLEALINIASNLKNLPDTSIIDGAIEEAQQAIEKALR